MELSFYQCLVKEGQLLQQSVHPEPDGRYVARRCHHSHIYKAVIQEYLHSKQTRKHTNHYSRMVESAMSMLRICATCSYLDVICSSQDEHFFGVTMRENSEVCGPPCFLHLPCSMRGQMFNCMGKPGLLTELYPPHILLLSQCCFSHQACRRDTNMHCFHINFPEWRLNPWVQLYQCEWAPNTRWYHYYDFLMGFWCVKWSS